MPDDKPTTQLPAVPEWAVELTRLAKTTKEEVRGLRADVGLVANDLSLVKERVAIIETWRIHACRGIRTACGSSPRRRAAST